MGELWTENPLLARLYDVECIGRDDHDFYLELAATLGAHRVVDIGCGTGVFAVDLAQRGHRVVGVDPAAAMLDVARQRLGCGDVEWIHGHADDVQPGVADLAIMMGHVAQYFVGDDEWTHVLEAVHRILGPGGWLAFEVRNPAIEWAHQWTRDRTTATHPHPDGGDFTAWVEVVDVAGPAHSYAMTHEGHTQLPDGRHLVATETLRFRSEREIRTSLDVTGFDVETTWGDWDRSPVTAGSTELIVLAQRR